MHKINTEYFKEEIKRQYKCNLLSFCLFIHFFTFTSLSCIDFSHKYEKYNVTKWKNLINIRMLDIYK